MRVIYTAGPYRGDGWNAVFENIIRARTAARKLWLRGWAVICPHANTLFMDGPEIQASAFIAGDLEKLADAFRSIAFWLTYQARTIDEYLPDPTREWSYDDEKGPDEHGPDGGC